MIPFRRNFLHFSLVQLDKLCFLLWYIFDIIQKEFEVNFPQKVIDGSQVLIVKMLKFVSCVDSVNDQVVDFSSHVVV